ncbi:MAG: hypothetical protein DIU67_010730, partial [Actinomycetes bacterium]
MTSESLETKLSSLAAERRILILGPPKVKEKLAWLADPHDQAEDGSDVTLVAGRIPPLREIPEGDIWLLCPFEELVDTPLPLADHGEWWIGELGKEEGPWLLIPFNGYLPRDLVENAHDLLAQNAFALRSRADKRLSEVSQIAASIDEAVTRRKKWRKDLLSAQKALRNAQRRLEQERRMTGAAVSHAHERLESHRRERSERFARAIAHWDQLAAEMSEQADPLKELSERLRRAEGLVDRWVL